MSGFFAALDGVQAVAAGALVAGLWQGVLLSAAAAVLLRVTPKTTPAVRFVVWTAVFGASVALPFLNLPGSGIAGGAGRSHVVFDARWSYVLAGLWLAASGYRLFDLVLQGVALRKLWKSAVPVADELLDGLEVPLVVRGRRVELCTSDEVDRPSVIGFLAPRILVPAWLFAELTAVELNHIVLHELEHLRRRDDWMNLLQKIGLVVLPLNPALFWIDRRLSSERELACDDGVLERTKMPRAYAASLASVAERRLDVRRGRKAGILALAATGLRRRSELGERIESILGRRAPVNRAVVGGLAAALVAGVVGSAAALARVPQLVAFGRSEAVQQATAAVPAESGLERGVRAQRVSFHVPTAETRGALMTQQSGIKDRIVLSRRKEDVPQRLKPRGDGGVYGTAEAVPLSKAGRSAAGESVLASRRVKAQTEEVTGQYVVLTSFDPDAPVSRVVVQTPDGKFVFVPYAAVPTEAGWLLVQL